jgi:demethylmenaquinone methyltransferase / 2-methoxy-6-polyprenyl-1,4-benzoquinol methylase
MCYEDASLRTRDSRSLDCEGLMQAPHPSLRRYYQTEAERSVWVRDIFDRTAADYDRVERVIGLGSGSWYRRQALRAAGLKPGMTVLDIGTGTGLVAREASTIVGDPQLVVGVDPSPGMVEHAKVPVGVRLVAGSAEAIPSPDAAADFLSMGYALRHISDLNLAFVEFFRVLHPGGRVCLLEITQPEGAVARTLLKAYLRGLIPAIAALISRHRDMPKLMRYYWDTIAACLPPAAIVKSLEAAGFIEVDRRMTLGVLSEYRARKPG